jgi:hypothetical protein
MTERPFIGLDQMPDDDTLERALNSAFAFYRDLIDLCSGFKREWVHTKGGGWMLKVADRKKALCYVIPLEDSFRVSMAIRESEHLALRTSDDMSEYEDLLDSARKFSEGYSIVFDVNTDSSYGHCKRFLERIIAARGL